MGNPLRVGVVGAGRISEKGHLPGFIQAGAQVVALCDVNPANLARLADQFHVQRRYSDWRQMLTDGDLDAVSVCVPPPLHCEIAVSSAQHGFHTLIEKPMALTLEECDQMIEAARIADVLLMVSHNQRFSARHVIAKEILSAGRLGKPYMVHAIFGHGGPENWSPSQQWYFNASAAKYGVIADLGSHKIDLVRWLLNQEVIEISAFQTTNEKPTALDDTVVMALRFSEGTLGTIQVSWVYRPGMTDSISISCERGVIQVPSDAASPVQVNEYDKPPAAYRFESDDVPGWFGSIRAFVNAVTTGGPSPVSGEEGRATMAAVLAAYESASQHTVIRLHQTLASKPHLSTER